MNHYYKLIDSRKQRKVIAGNYYEKHHVIPRCFGGTEVIFLTAKEHYIAHLLLAKGTDHPKMIKALHKMMFSHSSKNKRMYNITSKMYAYLRKAHAKVVSSYSKNTVVCYDITDNVYKRVAKSEFTQYKNIRYVAHNKGKQVSTSTILKRIASNFPFIVYINGKLSTNPGKSLVIALYTKTFKVQQVNKPTINKYIQILNQDINYNITPSELQQLIYDTIIVIAKPDVSTQQIDNYIHSKKRTYIGNKERSSKSRSTRTKMIYSTPLGTFNSTYDLMQAYPWIKHNGIINAISQNKKINNKVIYTTNIPELVGKYWVDVGFIFTLK